MAAACSLLNEKLLLQTGNGPIDGPRAVSQGTIPIRAESQKAILDKARKLAGFGSLIPSQRSYVHQLRVYEGNTLWAVLSSLHGLRHAYAQKRYEELTGWECPATGGPSSKSLSLEQRELDHEARLNISQELGHEREQVTAA